MENIKINEKTEKITPTFNKKIGSTNYVVNVNFSKTSTETIEDTIKRMILNECETLLNKGFCVNN